MHTKQTFIEAHVVCICNYSLLFTVLCAISLDLVMLSVLVATLEVVAHQCPFGWIVYNVLLETVTCLSVDTAAGETVTVHILMMLV